MAAVVNGREIAVAEVLATFPQGYTLRDRQKELRRRTTDVVLIEIIRQGLDEAGAPGPDPKAVADDERAARKRPAGPNPETRSFEIGLREQGFSLPWWRRVRTTQLRLDRHVDGFVDEGTLRRHYRDNRAVFDGTMVRASVILLAFDKHPRVSADELRGRLVVLREQISDTEGFNAAARDHSDAYHAQRGADVGKFFRRSPHTHEALLEAAFDLKPGEVSAPVRTSKGYWLLMVTERDKGAPVGFQDVRDRVRRDYTDVVRNKLMRQWRGVAAVKIMVK